MHLFNFGNIFYTSEDLTAHQKSANKSVLFDQVLCRPVINIHHHVKSKSLSEPFPSVQLTGEVMAHLSSNF